jgi:predicted RNase H-like nuclease (RuvC/YqgF family)
VAVALQRASSVPAQPQLAGMQLQLEATRREVAQLRANQRQPEETCGQAAAERAAARAEDQRIASGHRELQEAWKGMVDELKEQLKVIRDTANAAC